MFSVIFPGQGSQTVGMAKNIYERFSFVKELFHKADDILGVPISKMILNGPKEELDLTENTQPAIFIVSYSILQLIKKETNIDINKAKFCVGFITLQTNKLNKIIICIKTIHPLLWPSFFVNNGI